MPIEVGIWRLGQRVERIIFRPMPSESRLEDIIAEDIGILDPALLLIGRQVPTSYGKYIALLAMDGDRRLVVIELKRDRTPREVVAQLLDYGSWVRRLGDEDIASVFDVYRQKYCLAQPSLSLDQACGVLWFRVRSANPTLNQDPRRPPSRRPGRLTPGQQRRPLSPPLVHHVRGLHRGA